MTYHVSPLLRDPARLRELERVALLDTPPEHTFDRLTRLATRFLNTPIALVSFVDAERQFFKSCIGLPEPWTTTREAPLSHSFCQYVVASRAPFIVEDARVHPVVQQSLAITDLGIIAYVGIPLITPDGATIGSFCVADTQPRAWTPDDIAVLTDLAESVITEIALRIDVQDRERLEQVLRQAHNDLACRVVERTKALVDANTRLKQLVAEAQAAQARLRVLDAALQHIDETIMITEADLDLPGPRVVYVNQAFTHMTGYEVTEILGSTPRMLQGPGTDRAQLDRVRQALVQQQRYAGDIVNYRKDGSEYIVEWRIAAVRDATDTVTHWVSNQRDVTELRRQQAAAVHRQKLETLGTLAGGITHDFHTLLMAILVHTELAQLRLGPNSPADTQLDEIVMVVHRATELTQQLLSYAGKGRVELQMLDLNALVTDTLHLLQSSVIQRTAVQLHLDPDLPLIEAAVVQMRQLVMNVVTNAAMAVADTGGAIVVSTGVLRADRAFFAETYLAPDLPEGDYVYVRVRDTGVGMDVATQAKIFEPFFTTTVNGRGLGLAVVLGIVHAHGGAIKLDSAPGTGTTFTVLLPCVGVRADSATATHDALHEAGAR